MYVMHMISRKTTFYTLKTLENSAWLPSGPEALLPLANKQLVWAICFQLKSFPFTMDRCLSHRRSRKLLPVSKHKFDVMRASMKVCRLVNGFHFFPHLASVTRHRVCTKFTLTKQHPSKKGDWRHSPESRMSVVFQVAIGNRGYGRQVPTLKGSYPNNGQNFSVM